MLVIAGLTLVSRAQTEEAIRRKDAARAENRKTLVMFTSSGLEK